MAASIEAHNQKPAATWSSGGGAYDEVSHQISSALEHCVVRLDPKPGEKVLDLATGTGWTSRLEARRGAKVTGADIAEDLLADARARAAAENLAIEYKIGDAEKLPFGGGEFDAVSSTFGVMFVSRPEAAAAEIARVCRSGGRLAMTTWLPDSSVFKMFQVMRPYMAPPPNPAPPSPFEWGRQDRIRELFGSNFDLRFETGVTNYYDRSGQDAWNKFVTGYGPTKALRQASTRRGARTCSAISSTSTTASRPSSVSACRASTCSRSGYEDSAMQLGIVGLDRMGGNIVRRLTRRGHEWVPISSCRPCGMGLAVASNRRRPAEAASKG